MIDILIDSYNRRGFIMLFHRGKIRNPQTVSHNVFIPRAIQPEMGYCRWPCVRACVRSFVWPHISRTTYPINQIFYAHTSYNWAVCKKYFFQTPPSPEWSWRSLHFSFYKQLHFLVLKLINFVHVFLIKNSLFSSWGVAQKLSNLFRD